MNTVADSLTAQPNSAAAQGRRKALRKAHICVYGIRRKNERGISGGGVEAADAQNTLHTPFEGNYLP